ncbi:MAG: hypothetical protein R2873_11565 [Caldilineaceae bacterium]
MEAGPGRLVAVGGHAEVEAHGGVALVDVLGVGQDLREGAKEQIAFLERAEVLAVDPDQIDAAVAVHARRLFGQHLVDGVCRVFQRYAVEREAVLIGQRTTDGSVHVGVDQIRAAPQRPGDGRPLGGGDDFVPAGGGRIERCFVRGGFCSRAWGFGHRHGRGTASHQPQPDEHQQESLHHFSPS